MVIREVTEPTSPDPNLAEQKLLLVQQHQNSNQPAYKAQSEEMLGYASLQADDSN